MEFLIQISLILMAIFIILLVLVQRGKGGGLAGALGGPGGSSAFGAKAGDTFTRITIYTVVIWILMCLGASYWASHRGDALDAANSATITNTSESVEPGMGSVADGSVADGSVADGSATEGTKAEAAPTNDSSTDASTPPAGEATPDSESAE